MISYTDTGLLESPPLTNLPRDDIASQHGSLRDYRYTVTFTSVVGLWEGRMIVAVTLASIRLSNERHLSHLPSVSLLKTNLRLSIYTEYLS